MFARSRLRLFAAWHLLLVVVASEYGHALMADAGPTYLRSVTPAPATLSPAAERRAEAMARVAAGYLAAEKGPDEAMAHYLRAMELDWSNAALAQELSAMHLQRDEVPEALAVLKDSLKHNPQSAELALRIAGVYVVSLRKLEPAERYAKQALAAAPDTIEPYQMLYSVYRAGGRSDQAEAVLARAAARKNDDPLFWAGLGDLTTRHLLGEGKLRDEAASAVVAGYYRRAAESGRQDATVQLRALNYFFASGNMADAEAAGRRLLVLQPSDTSSREKLALAILAQGREDEAIVEMEAVIAENPASLIAYRTHGDILLRRGDVSGALSKFEKALLLHDEDPRLYLEVVELCVRNENLDRAVWWLGQARSRYDRLPDLPLYEGQILGHLKRWREALNAFNAAAELAAQHQPSLLTADFHFQHGVMAERSGEHDAAVRHFRACLQRDPNHAGAMNYLGYMWAERGENLAEAETFIRRAVEMEPENAAYLDSLGWVLYQQGRFHEALVPLEQAAKLSADAPDATIEEHLGDVLDKLGRRNEAVKAWERAASLGGGSVGLAAKLQAARGAPAAETASGSKTRKP